MSRFTNAMSIAFPKWRTLDGEVNADEKRAHIPALVYSAVIAENATGQNWSKKPDPIWIDVLII